MKDYDRDLLVFIVVCTLGLAIGIGTLAYQEGRDKETQRIYQKCLDKNGTLAYNDAMKLCKELIK